MKQIKLFSSKYPNLVALVDDEDFDRLNEFRWHPYKDKTTFYAIRNIDDGNGGHTTRPMHQEILGRVAGSVIDHRDGDGLNNQKGNIRRCTQGENTRNARLRSDSTSRVKGVTWFAKDRKWRARIQANKKAVFLGYFDTIEEARSAYEAASKRLHGEFGRTA
jgi:hypothetical protein